MGPPRGHTSPIAGHGRGPTLGPLGGSGDQADSMADTPEGPWRLRASLYAELVASFSAESAGP
eukprot:3186934-Pyramimonas_sp.AAC.1